MFPSFVCTAAAWSKTFMQPKRDTFYNIKGNGEESEAKAESNL